MRHFSSLALALSTLLACGSSDAPPASSSSSGSSGGTSSGSTSSGGTGTDGGAVLPDGAPATSGGSPLVAGCKIFPADNPWNRDVSADPVDDATMAAVLPNMHAGTALHADWGSFSDNYGIPITAGPPGLPVPMTWSTSYGNKESDKAPCAAGEFCYPIPLSAKIEGGIGAASTSDRHVVFLDTSGAPDKCTLYELYNAQNGATLTGWIASNGAIFHLDSDALRPDGWTSADAAGLPVLPGLVRADEVAAGKISHAIRFTMQSTYNGYIHPATHAAGLSSNKMPPMGMRMRLKASFDLSGFNGPALVILTAMKRYGLILADNGSNWYVSGETSDAWTSDVMSAISQAMGKVHGGDFEIVKTGAVLTSGL